MSINQRLLLGLYLWLLLLAVCSSAPHTALTTITGAQGGAIVYGVVEGVTTRPAAIASVLRSVHNSSGEKPQVGKVFRARETNSDAVFFTVVDHSQDNRLMAGLLMAFETGPGKIEAAMVTDGAARFSSTINPLLSQLFKSWHPLGASTSGAGAVGAGLVPPMQQVMLSDRTATLSLPAGWNVDPLSGGGTAFVRGPQGEFLGLNGYFGAIDTNGPYYQEQTRMKLKPFPSIVYCPGDVDLTKSFTDVWQRLRAANKRGPAPMKMEKVQEVPGNAGWQCVDVTCQIDPDGKGMKEMRAFLCRTPIDKIGTYSFVLSQNLLPLDATDKQWATAYAIMGSYRVDTPLVRALADEQAEETREAIDLQQQTLTDIHQLASDAIRRIEARAKTYARLADAGTDPGEPWDRIDFPRSEQVILIYALDPSVLQNGQVADAAMWSSIADAMVSAKPSRYEIVNTPDYWNGGDY